MALVGIGIWAASLPADQTIPVGPVLTSTWAEGEVITLVGSIQVVGELTIEPDVEVLVPPNSVISVQSTGRIVASGEASREIHFHSSAPSPMPGDWQTIFLMQSSGMESSFDHVVIEHARIGLTIQGVSPTIQNCTLRNLGARDGLDGIDGSPGTPGDPPLLTAGIAANLGARPVITNNLIEMVTGGNGGSGGNGVSGIDGMDGSVPGDPGDDGVSGQPGGDGGAGGEASGILLDGGGTAAVPSFNVIRQIQGGNGGNGGIGGDGGNGGVGGQNADGGGGGDSGGGGAGGAGGIAAGIRLINGAFAIASSNETSQVVGGGGGAGAFSGANGNGGAGGSGLNGTTNPDVDAGDGGDGGNGYPAMSNFPHRGGDGGDGGEAHGIFADTSILGAAWNMVADIQGGGGGRGGRSDGSGGNGGRGGDGGDGIGSQSAAGSGGMGGNPNFAEPPGAAGIGGNARGVTVESPSILTVVRANRIEMLRGGPGGTGGEGGRGGNGGDGGNGGGGALFFGSGGPGEDGREGSGANGGDGGFAIGITVGTVPGESVVNENWIHALEGGPGGFPDDVGVAGGGGDGGTGTVGGSGGHGPPGTPGGGGGNGGLALGIFINASTVETSNNIVWEFRGGVPGEPNDAGPGGDGGNGGFGILSSGAGGNGGDGGFGGPGGRHGSTVALFDTGATVDHYHETIADLAAGIAGTLPSPPGSGGSGGTGSTPGTDGGQPAPANPPDPSSGNGLASSGTSTSVLNNSIFWQPSSSAATGVRQSVNATATTDYNIFHNVGTPTDGTALGGNDLLIDPLLANPASGDFRLRRLSPAVDSGTARGITEDIDGHPRPFDVPGRGAEMTGFEFDRGAYESITGRTGYQTWEILEALLNGVTLSGSNDPLDVNGDLLFDVGDLVTNVEDVSAIGP